MMAIAMNLAWAIGAALAMAASLGPVLGAPRDGGSAQDAATMPARTGKERLGNKASDEQRVDDCKVPLALRSARARPTACGVAPAAAAAAATSRTVVYVCGTDRITVRYIGIDNPGGAPRASLRLPNGRSVMLPQAMSASGARYSDGTVTLWEHQGTALIETPERSWTGCVPRPV